MTYLDQNARVGLAIREARTTLGMSQEELATALNVRRASVSLWENGKLPGPLNMAALREILGAAYEDPKPTLSTDEMAYWTRRVESVARDMEAVLARQRELARDMAVPLHMASTADLSDELRNRALATQQAASDAQTPAGRAASQRSAHRR